MTVSAPATVPAETVLDPLQGEPRSFEDWVTTFHLTLVGLDPFKQASGILIPTAARILRNFSGSNCRMAWLVAGTPEQALEFLGPWTEDILTFADPERAAIKALGIATLPAIVHVNQGLEIVNLAQGWNPLEWRHVSDTLAQKMRWSRPDIPQPSDPSPFYGTPV